MKLIESKVEIIEQEPGLEGVYKQIEKAGRLCYKSEDKICEGSAEKMVENLMKRGHGSPLEHGTVYLKAPSYTQDGRPQGALEKYKNNKYSIVKVHDYFSYVTTNLRVLFENGWMNDLDYWCEPTEFHEKRITVKMNCSIGISREFNRHRANSVCETSTRYCNYSKDKFGSEITFVIPEWVKDKINETAS